MCRQLRRKTLIPQNKQSNRFLLPLEVAPMKYTHTCCIINQLHNLHFALHFVRLWIDFKLLFNRRWLEDETLIDLMANRVLTSTSYWPYVTSCSYDLSGPGILLHSDYLWRVMISQDLTQIGMRIDRNSFFPNLSASYIDIPVGGDKWLYKWVIHSNGSFKNADSYSEWVIESLVCLTWSGTAQTAQSDTFYFP